LHRIDIKPLSVNQAWIGKLSKTSALRKYISDVGYILPNNKKELTGKLKLIIKFGFSSKASDIDNPLKPFIDCLQDKYDFDDKQIFELVVFKDVVKRGKEYIEFEIIEL